MLDHLADLESDFSVFHHIDIDIDADDFGGLSAPRFFRLAERIFAYAGVLQARVIAEQQEGEEMGSGNQPTTGGRGDVVASSRNHGHYEDGRPVGPGMHGKPVAVPLTPEMVAGGALGGGYGSREDTQALDGLMEYRTAPAL